MNILILGGFGFIGTNIIKYIDTYEKDVNVIVFDRFPSHLNHVEFESISKVYSGDFSDEFLLKNVFDETPIDLVIHSLSASIPSSSQDNEFDIKFNVLPTIQLLNQMVIHQVNKLVFISSGGAIYGDHYIDVKGHEEKEVLFPKSSYGISKLIIEKYLYLYSVQHQMKFLVLRLSNPYGPFHYSQKQGVINIALERAIKGQTFEIWGDGNGKKDYIFIEDFCKILMLLIKKWGDNYTVFNVGSGQLASVNEIVEIIRDNVERSFDWSYVNSNSLDVQDFRLNLSHLNEQLEGFSFTNIKDGILKTRAWYDSLDRKDN